jgi:hypothetical protein
VRFVEPVDRAVQLMRIWAEIGLGVRRDVGFQ